MQGFSSEKRPTPRLRCGLVNEDDRPLSQAAIREALSQAATASAVLPPDVTKKFAPPTPIIAPDLMKTVLGAKSPFARGEGVAALTGLTKSPFARGEGFAALTGLTKSPFARGE